MPRRARVSKRIVPPDPKCGDTRVSRFINKVMEGGKKSVAEKIVYGALDIAGRMTGKSPLEVFEQALENAMPMLETKPRRVGGATYQIPVEIRGDRRMSLGMRWLIKYASARAGRSMAEKLAAELLDAARGAGATVKKKEDTHKMAEANKAFAHYRW
ncbi:MAG: 30S ribosomal protein S7 [Chloroflexi bacterium]|nr:30S ribosomal protein S7 [Chloroflexota bacterium]